MAEDTERGMRVDKWLWMVRLYKTRTLAIEAVKKSQVKMEGKVVKPARPLEIGEEVSVKKGPLTRVVKVLDYPPSRIGAKLVPDYYEDLTDPVEIEKARAISKENSLNRILSEPGQGRPSKRDLRKMKKFLGEE